MSLSPDDSRPPYLQIADALRTAIRSGEFAPGSQLAPATDLASKYGVARNTVRSALRVLTEEGLLVSRQGSGVFVRSALPEPIHTGNDGSRIDAVVRELTDVRHEVQDLKQRMTHLESLVERQDTHDV